MNSKSLNELIVDCPTFLILINELSLGYEKKKEGTNTVRPQVKCFGND